MGVNVSKGCWGILLLLFVVSCAFPAGAQGEPEQVLLPSARTMPSMLQVDRLRGQLDEAQTEEEQYRLLSELVRSLERLRTTVELSEAYAQMFQLSPLADPALRFRWIVRYGSYLEGQARPSEAVRV